jgi:hypothetical protein
MGRKGHIKNWMLYDFSKSGEKQGGAWVICTHTLAFEERNVAKIFLATKVYLLLQPANLAHKLKFLLTSTMSSRSTVRVT